MTFHALGQPDARFSSHARYQGLGATTPSGKPPVANRECPVFEELAGLLRKTAGLVDVVRGALQPLADRISAAFVCGSVAQGTESARSDVDLMIVGDVSFAQAVKSVEPIQNTLRREVNPTVMKRSEFLRKHQEKDGFVSTVWKSPKLWVIGGEHELG